jgi:hypothetical protein
MDALAQPLEDLTQDQLRARVDMYEVLGDFMPFGEQPTKRRGVGFGVQVATVALVTRRLGGLVEGRQWVLAKEQLDPLEGAPPFSVLESIAPWACKVHLRADTAQSQSPEARARREVRRFSRPPGREG